MSFDNDKVRSYNIFTSQQDVNNMVEQALKHLPPLGFTHKLSFERVGQGMFDSAIIGAVTNGPEHKITINLDWYEATDEQDLHYIIWHETRHLYQWSQIEKLNKGEPILDDETVIQKWEYEIHNYICNSKTTEFQHMKQEMEIDAYAFAVYMLFHYYRKSDGQVYIGLPPMIEDEIMDRVQKSAKADWNVFKRIEGMGADLIKLKKQCDVVIVLYHGGKEFYRYPVPYVQKRCRKMADAGADFILCQHSHCIGAYEEYQGATILYGQGNFLFCRKDDEFRHTGLLVSIEIENNNKNIEFIPVVRNNEKVRLANETEKKGNYECI